MYSLLRELSQTIHYHVNVACYQVDFRNTINRSISHSLSPLCQEISLFPKSESQDFYQASNANAVCTMVFRSAIKNDEKDSISFIEILEYTDYLPSHLFNDDDNASHFDFSLCKCSLIVTLFLLYRRNVL